MDLLYLIGDGLRSKIGPSEPAQYPPLRVAGRSTLALHHCRLLQAAGRKVDNPRSLQQPSDCGGGGGGLKVAVDKHRSWAARARAPPQNFLILRNNFSEELCHIETLRFY